MPHLLSQWVFEAVGADRANDVVNTTHWFAAEPFAVSGGQFIHDALFDFYSTTTGGPQLVDRVAGYMSDNLTGNYSQKLYNVDDPKPRAPVAEFSGSMTMSASDQSLPNEVAVVVSYQADEVSGLRQARRRGRFYVGPLAINAASPQGTRPHTDFINVLANSLGRLIAAAGAAADHSLVIVSSVATERPDVTNGWVDNAWDTQRRRGLPPSSKTIAVEL